MDRFVVVTKKCKSNEVLEKGPNKKQRTELSSEQYISAFPITRTVGEYVECLFPDDGLFYNALIDKVHLDGHYDITFEDGVTRERVKPSEIQDQDLDPLGGNNSAIPPNSKPKSGKQSQPTVVTRPEEPVKQGFFLLLINNFDSLNNID